MSRYGSPSRVILPTARIWLKNSKVMRVECRMLLDLEFNFILQDLCQRLNLSTHKLTSSVKGLGASIEIHEATESIIQSQHTVTYGVASAPFLAIAASST